MLIIMQVEKMKKRHELIVYIGSVDQENLFFIDSNKKKKNEKCDWPGKQFFLLLLFLFDTQNKQLNSVKGITRTYRNETSDL